MNELSPINPNEFQFFYTSATKSIISKTDYLIACQKIIDKISTSSIKKIVYSRVQKENYKQSPLEIFESLNSNYKNSFNYIISIENIGTWIGATPEQFIKIEENTLNTVSLAGTKTDNTIPWGEKEIVEQGIVSDFIVAQLTKNKCLNIEVNGPITIDTGAVSHLKTSFQAQVNHSNISDIINSLHPTPATCGLPKKSSREELLHIEKHDRKFYTGFLGMVDKSKINLFVNLRCMEIDAKHAYLYLGGGITHDSDPLLEWEETNHKAKTLRKYLN